MKKSKLLIDYEFDFTLFALLTDLREYKLAWHINQALHIRLVKEEDLRFNFLNSQNLIISNYKFATEHTTFRLLKNKSVQDGSNIFLIPELSQFDFLIMLQGVGDFFEGIDVEKALKEIPLVQYLSNVNINQLKSRENLIF
jgi:hypothetical protein